MTTDSIHSGTRYDMTAAPIPLVITMQVEGVPARPMYGLLSDISDTGAGLFLSQSLPLNQAILLSFQTQNIELSCVVVWCSEYHRQNASMQNDDPMSSQYQFKAGITFLDAQQKNIQTLLQLLQADHEPSSTPP